MGHTLRVVLDTNVLLSGIAYPGSLTGEVLAAMTAWLAERAAVTVHSDCSLPIGKLLK